MCLRAVRDSQLCRGSLVERLGVSCLSRLQPDSAVTRRKQDPRPMRIRIWMQDVNLVAWDGQGSVYRSLTRRKCHVIVMNSLPQCQAMTDAPIRSSSLEGTAVTPHHSAPTFCLASVSQHYLTIYPRTNTAFYPRKPAAP